jgi:hypothetical protein
VGAGIGWQGRFCSSPHPLQINGFGLLPITHQHCATLLTLPYHHRDLFDPDEGAAEVIYSSTGTTSLSMM